MGKKSLLNIHKKMNKKANEERNERAQKFMDEYREVSKKYRIDFYAELSVKPNGVFPVLRLKELQAEPELKPWSEAKKENLENRKNCTHVKRDDDVLDCKLCGLPVENWGKDGIGATEEYIERTEAQIVEIAKAEKEEKAEREKMELEAMEEAEWEQTEEESK